MNSEIAPTIGAPIVVLIVDDDRGTTEAVALALEAEPEFRCLDPVHSGEAAIAAYAAERPDVVLMDVNLGPGMSGVEATAEILRRDPEARVLLLTTISPGPGIARALEAGAMAAVNKTVPARVLSGAVQAAARGEDPALLKRLARGIMVSGDVLPDTPIVAPKLTDAEYRVLLLVCQGVSTRRSPRTRKSRCGPRRRT